MATKQMKAPTRFVMFLSLALMGAVHAQMGKGGLQKFPFEVQLAEDYVKGYRFFDVAEVTSGAQEVMIVTPQGNVIFPADIKYTGPFLKVFYPKVRQEIQDKGGKEDPVVEMIRIITPRSGTRMLIFPEIESKETAMCAEYLGLEAQDFEKVVEEWSLRAKTAVGKNAAHIKVVTILHGNVIREYQMKLSPDGTQLESVSLSGSHVFPRKEVKEGSSQLLPPVAK